MEGEPIRQVGAAGDAGLACRRAPRKGGRAAVAEGKGAETDEGGKDNRGEVRRLLASGSLHGVTSCRLLAFALYYLGTSSRRNLRLDTRIWTSQVGAELFVVVVALLLRHLQNIETCVRDQSDNWREGRSDDIKIALGGGSCEGYGHLTSQHGKHPLGVRIER